MVNNLGFKKIEKRIEIDNKTIQCVLFIYLFIIISPTINIGRSAIFFNLLLP